jgi:O-antigen/teichoic acid export membrane protein
MTNTRTIARNTSWYGIENIINLFVTVFSSIAIARTLGPSKTGYIVYISFMAGVVSSLGGLGIPATTRKYMAEFLGKGDRGTARFIYFRTLLLQTGLATLATGGLLFWELTHAAMEYKLASVLIVLSIWPAMVNSISAQANVATEDLFANLPPSALSILTYLVMITLTVVLNWGVIGIGAAQLSMRAVDFLLRVFPTFKRVLGWETINHYPDELRKRMTSFAWQSVVSMTVALVVWNRSEVFLLKNLCADIRQVAYYSIAFSMSDMLLFSAIIFGSATGATIFAQYGRDKSKLPEISSAAFRYLALSSIPLHFIATALAAPGMLLVYGHQFAGAAMVVTLAPLLCMPKAFVGPVQNLLESNERQNYVIMATVVAGIVDISVAWSLIPSFGAVGACIGSGTAQFTAVGIMWTIGIHSYKIKLPWTQVAKIVCISLIAALTAHFIAVCLSPVWAILFGGSASLIVLFGLFYLLRVLEPEDFNRLHILASMVPQPIAHPAGKFLALLTRPSSGNGWATNKYPLPQEHIGLKPVIATVYRRSFSMAARQHLWNIRKSYSGIALKMKLVPIKVDACLRGGDNGVPAATFARMRGDIRYASRPISEWPHVTLLREYDRIGERLWHPEIFQNTDYYRNAALNIELCGKYFDAIVPEQIHWGARRFAYAYHGLDERDFLRGIPRYIRDPYEYIAVRRVKDSAYYQVCEGHHRLAIAYMKGIKEVTGIILQPPVSTPLQELLLDCFSLKGRRELYQPIDSPEVAKWVLVRRCTDRLAKMTDFLRAEGLMPPVSRSYLDVASDYGWFVSQMTKAGFLSHGVDRDPTAITVGKVMYGLHPEQLHRADAAVFLRALKDKYDVTSCLSLAHHYILTPHNISAEELLHLMDLATRSVMFFDMGQGHEFPGSNLDGWEPDHIHRWLEANTTFTRIVRLGKDEDSVPPNQHNYSRMLFACVR